MRISDWSSDVCSSDLLPSLKLKQAPPSPPALIQQHLIAGEPQFQSCAQMDKPSRVGYGLHRRNTQPAKSARYWSASTCRSEEHTSELQSLMRISYAVFCLKKKTQQHQHKNTKSQHHNHDA